MSGNDDPTRVEREAMPELLELMRSLGGPLVWTGPIPYDALAARHSVAQLHRGSRPDDLAMIPAQAKAANSTVAA
jgi:hypothetical protein